MTDDENPWSPARFVEQFGEAGERALREQMEMTQRMFGAGAGAGDGLDGFSQLDALSRTTATFKTRVQSGGRISIPDAEREALGIEDGDIVQTVVIPIKRPDDDE